MRRGGCRGSGSKSAKSCGSALCANLSQSFGWSGTKNITEVEEPECPPPGPERPPTPGIIRSSTSCVVSSSKPILSPNQPAISSLTVIPATPKTNTEATENRKAVVFPRFLFIAIILTHGLSKAHLEQLQVGPAGRAGIPNSSNAGPEAMQKRSRTVQPKKFDKF